MGGEIKTSHKTIIGRGIVLKKVIVKATEEQKIIEVGAISFKTVSEIRQAKAEDDVHRSWDKEIWQLK